jgi:hypothetical protein
MMEADQCYPPAIASASGQHADDDHVLGEVRQAGLEAAEESSAEKRDLVTGEWNQPGPAEPEGAADGPVGTVTMVHSSEQSHKRGQA